jgi:hypothetical protein
MNMPRGINFAIPLKNFKLKKFKAKKQLTFSKTLRDFSPN